MEYASKGIANAGLTTGIIGTALSGLLTLGGNNIFGGRMAAAGAADGEHLVSRYELQLTQENAVLKAQADVDKKLVEVYNSINDKANSIRESFNAFEKEQLVYNGVNTATIGCIQNQVNALMGMTKLVIPNSSVCPGWGNATVTVTPGTTTA
nr:MAG TPA: hypothetical protein [Caudoviricetes sp.]